MKSIFLWILLLIIIIYIINLKMYEGYTQSKFVDYPNNDLIYFPTVTKGQCENTCNANSTCKGYVTDFVFGFGPGKCWLKTKFDSNNAIVHTGRITNIK